MGNVLSYIGSIKNPFYTKTTHKTKIIHQSGVIQCCGDEIYDDDKIYDDEIYDDADDDEIYDDADDETEATNIWIPNGLYNIFSVFKKHKTYKKHSSEYEIR
jgi:hypothetical protein